jgi:hypothetical protein
MSKSKMFIKANKSESKNFGQKIESYSHTKSNSVLYFSSILSIYVVEVTNYNSMELTHKNEN